MVTEIKQPKPYETLAVIAEPTVGSLNQYWVWVITGNGYVLCVSDQQHKTKKGAVKAGALILNHIAATILQDVNRASEVEAKRGVTTPR